MHYYKRNLGDYAKKAGRLSMLQHGAYNLLIDACYDRERFPTLEEAIDWTWASTTDEEEAVKFILKRFFTKQDDGTFVQQRIADELNEYQSKAEKNRLISIYREYAKRERKAGNEPIDFESWQMRHDSCEKTNETCTSGSRDDHERSPNQEPLTINQEPLTKNQEPLFTDNECSDLPPETSEPEPGEEVLITFPTTKFNTQNEVFSVTRTFYNEMLELFPAVDVSQQLRNMRSWAITNPTKRKTIRGYPKFVNNWLTKEQNKGGSSYATSRQDTFGTATSHVLGSGDTNW